MRLVALVGAAVLVAGWSAAKEPKDLKPLADGKPVPFRGTILGPDDVSALGVVGDYLVIGSDAGNAVQILKRDGDGYAVIRDLPLNDTGKEIDIEGIACEGDTVYVIGSHSWVRETIKDDKPFDKNRAKFAQLHPPEGDKYARDRLFRFRLDASGKPFEIAETSLRKVLDANPILAPFTKVPSKENGIDIEGLAVRDGRLYVGFRGPVLRGHYAPILACRFDDPADGPELMFVQLGGYGVRDITRVKGGFLILAGAVAEGDHDVKLYFWDGHDCLAGERPDGSKRGRCVPLAEVPPPSKKAKAEGLTVLKEAADHYEILVVFDGAPGGAPTKYRAPKP
jgi:hypothetical protein